MGKKQAQPDKLDIRARWRITAMSAWDADFVDADGAASIEFRRGGRGSFHFGYINCGIDWLSEEGNSRAAFTFDGFDEMSPTSGRGWAQVLPKGILKGHLSFHRGDDSAFQARRTTG